MQPEPNKAGPVIFDSIIEAQSDECVFLGLFTVVSAAERLAAVRETLNERRLAMGLPPVLDVDAAELRSVLLACIEVNPSCVQTLRLPLCIEVNAPCTALMVHWLF